VGLGIADLIVIAFLVGAGCLLCSIGLWAMLRQLLSARQSELGSRLDALAGALKTLEAKVDDLGKQPEEPKIAAPVAEAQAPAAAPLPAVQSQQEVTPEMLVVIAAAVTAFLGKKVRIRSAKLVRPREAVSAWSQHGRAQVHSSHNPRARF
jgi:methylmalonyl-CoA carboxyltransferase large subunit